MAPTRPLLAIICLGCAALPVDAAEQSLQVPRFDPEAYCSYASVNSQGVYDKKQCTDEEKRSAELVRQQWNRIPREVQITCGEIVRRSGQSYFILKACLKNFAGAAWSSVAEDGNILDRSQQIAKSFQRR
jgi:ribosomal protein L37AE/L43A